MINEAVTLYDLVSLYGEAVFLILSFLVDACMVSTIVIGTIAVPLLIAEGIKAFDAAGVRRNNRR